VTVPDTGERSESGGIVLAANAGPRVPSGVVTRPSVIYLIVNKLLSLSLSLSLLPSLTPPPCLGRRGVPSPGRREEEEGGGGGGSPLHLPPSPSSLPQTHRWKRTVSRFLSRTESRCLSDGSSFFFMTSFKLMFLMPCFSGRNSHKSSISLVIGLAE